MARYIHAYFNRREPSDWKLEEFMRECDLSSAAKKSDAWIKSLRALSGQAGPVRDRANSTTRTIQVGECRHLPSAGVGAQLTFLVG